MEGVCALNKRGAQLRALQVILSSHTTSDPFPVLRTPSASAHALLRTLTGPINPFAHSLLPTGVGEDGSKALPHAIAAASVLAGWLRDCPSAVSALMEVPDAMQGIIAAVAHGYVRRKARWGALINRTAQSCRQAVFLPRIAAPHPCHSPPHRTTLLRMPLTIGRPPATKPQWAWSPSCWANACFLVEMDR